MNAVRSALIVISTALSILGTVCTAHAGGEIYHVVVIGGPALDSQKVANLERLKSYHAALRKELGLKRPSTPGDITNLWKAKVGCANCNKLEDGSASDLEYIIERSAKEKVLVAFSKAWRIVERADITSDGSIEKFQVRLDAEKGGDPTCTQWPTPPACHVRYSCPQQPTPKCSRTLTGLCAPCT